MPIKAVSGRFRSFKKRISRNIMKKVGSDKRMDRRTDRRTDVGIDKLSFRGVIFLKMA